MDLYLLQKINQWAGQNIYLESLAIFCAQYLGYILIFALLIILLINWRKHWQPVVFSFLSAILARFVFVEIIRYLWPRPRPFLVTKIHLLIDKTNQASFPSGHAAFYFALAFFLFFYFRKNYSSSKLWQGIGLLFLLGAITISLARVFVGIHWPSDVLAGAILGIFTAYLTNYSITKLSQNKKRR